MTEATWEDEERAWLEARQEGIGATDAAPILGLSRWGSRLTVYNSKTEPVLVEPPSLAAWLGLELESSVGKLYTAQTQRKLRHQSRDRVFRHPLRPWQMCHLDYKAAGRIVEVKTTAWGDEYGDPGTEQVPIGVWVQCQHEMAVTDYGWCDVAALIGNRRFGIYPIARNEEFIVAMTEQERVLWEEHILPRIPPEPDGSDVTTALLRRQHPVDTQPPRAALAEEMPLVERLRMAQQNQKQTKTAYDEIRNKLIVRIGEAGGLFGPGFRIDFKKNRDSVVTRTDWALVATTYRNALEGIANGTLTAAEIAALDLDALVGLYTITKTEPGDRPFRLTWKEANATSE